MTLAHDSITGVRLPRRAPWLVSGLGMLSVTALLGWWALLLSPTDVTFLLLSLGTTGMPALGLVWGGYRLARSEIEPTRYGRIVAWFLSGAIGVLGVTLATMLIFPWTSLVGTVLWAHFAITAGAVAGFAIGTVEARAIQREVEATAAAVRADQLAEEREVLTYLNALLRHEVLNSTQIIGGNASLLLKDVADVHDHDHNHGHDHDRRRERLETIERESEALEAVIDDVRSLLDANARPNRPAVIDLAILLEETVTTMRATTDAEIDATIPESVTVEGNDGVRRIFENLLENAIEHNDSETPRVAVTAETGTETVVVTVADDGPGIPDELRETLFERKSQDHGLGLYLARILTNRYGGSIELAETGPDGSTFTVTLPRASESDSGSSPRASKRDETGRHETDASNGYDDEDVACDGSEDDEMATIDRS